MIAIDVRLGPMTNVWGATSTAMSALCPFSLFFDERKNGSLPDCEI